jgi:hypothetical protein
MQLSLLDAIEARDKGINKALTHAEQECEGWGEKAYDLIKQYLSEVSTSFMAEEIRSYAAMYDFPLPPHARAWGAVIVRAAKEGLIKKVGYGQVMNRKAHMANASVWIKN